MRLQILTIGKPKLGYARAGVEEYVERLRGFGGVTITELKAGSQVQESASLIERSEGLLRVVLDERGDQITSRDLAARLSRWELDRVKGVSFLIGGADGHTEELRRRADWRWSLSKLTLQHELALVVLLEQLYRARSINAGAPYHRD
jgi:23S rRNA (pseudouridine1915-N3)-methyltransferase